MSLAEKKALVAHEYGHMILNRNLAEHFPEVVSFWRYSSEYQLLKLNDDLITANDVRLKQLDLLEEFHAMPFYNAMGELFADVVAVVSLKEPNIISSLIGKSYLQKFPKIDDLSQLSLAAQEKLAYRQFQVSSNFAPEVSADIHQTFYLVRQALGPRLKEAFASQEQANKLLEDMVQASRLTLDHFLQKDPQALRSFREFNDMLENESPLSAIEKLSFQNLVEKFNQVFLKNLNSLK